MLKLTGGEFKGRKLLTPKGIDIRPTLEKTREAIFDVLTSRFELQHYNVFDLFAGSGALGFEAASRGAERIVFLEKDKYIFAVIRQNIERLAISKRCTAKCQDVIQWIKKKEWNSSSNLFLIDPPYKTDLTQEVVNLFNEKKGLLNGSLIVIETHKKYAIEYPKEFVMFQQKTYGKTRIDFVEINATSK